MWSNDVRRACEVRSSQCRGQRGCHLKSKDCPVWRADLVPWVAHTKGLWNPEWAIWILRKAVFPTSLWSRTIGRTKYEKKKAREHPFLNGFQENKPFLCTSCGRLDWVPLGQNPGPSSSTPGQFLLVLRCLRVWSALITLSRKSRTGLPFPDLRNTPSGWGSCWNQREGTRMPSACFPIFTSSLHQTAHSLI